MNPDADFKKSAKDLLRNIIECKVKPSWWEWWLCSPIYKWRKIAFLIISLTVVSLIFFHTWINYFFQLSIRFMNNFIKNSTELSSYFETIGDVMILSPLNWTIYIIGIILLILILFLPSIRQIAGQGVTIQIQDQEPIAGFHLPMPPFRFEHVNISELKKSSQMFIPPARKLTRKWAPVYPEFLELDLWE